MLSILVRFRSIVNHTTYTIHIHTYIEIYIHIYIIYIYIHVCMYVSVPVYNYIKSKHYVMRSKCCYKVAIALQ